MRVTAVELVPPKLTLDPLLKFVPVIVTTFPPLMGPDEGETLATVAVEVEVAVVGLNTTSTQ